jgi:hypothetical protein
MSHLIDVGPPCLREATKEKVWQDAITKEYQYTLKLMYKILFRDQK